MSEMVPLYGFGGGGGGTAEKHSGHSSMSWHSVQRKHRGLTSARQYTQHFLLSSAIFCCWGPPSCAPAKPPRLPRPERPLQPACWVAHLASARRRPGAGPASKNSHS